jgi:glyoxylase-like metal-dependent hydrolase (beta-lactamase superfamily II)
MTAREVAHGVHYVPALMSNVVFLGERDGPWIVVDAGVPGMAARIRAAAESIYGNREPDAIVLTHGHFDHVGSVRDLAEQWDVPVFAHPLEFPFLDGRDDYPPPDPTVGGFMAQMSRLFPHKGINIRHRLRPLPMDFTVPFAHGWRFVHTPGHTPGHVSFFRDEDRFLIAGDAVISIDQQKPGKLMAQVREFFPPPWYFTIDWKQSHESVQKLAALHPNAVVCGHGLPVEGEEVAPELTRLAASFWGKAPKHGRYVQSPAKADERGVYEIPPPVADPVPKYAAGVALAAAGMLAVGMLASRERIHTR